MTEATHADQLRVRVYNVNFGDAILVSVPDREDGQTTIRHILIDVGNVLSGHGGDDKVFVPVLEDVLRELHGKPLDLYVMTHEHMDHVKGLLAAKTKYNLTIPVAFSWLTASADPTYYETHDAAKEQKRKVLEAYHAIDRYLAVVPEQVTNFTAHLLANNNPRSTADCVALLRDLAGTQTSYVHREFDTTDRHPFREAKLSLLAPEEDTSRYYGTLLPMALNLADAAEARQRESLMRPRPPSGVDAGTFYSLVDARSRGIADNLLTIDQAANNTSLVIMLEWRGWRLMFAGDAEIKSWRMMNEIGALAPVHFLKVSHHGSHNGTPQPAILDRVLPLTPPDDRNRVGVISTCRDVYGNVPDDATLAELRKRCEVYTVLEIAPGSHFDVTFDGDGAAPATRVVMPAASHHRRSN